MIKMQKIDSPSHGTSHTLDNRNISVKPNDIDSSNEVARRQLAKSQAEEKKRARTAPEQQTAERLATATQQIAGTIEESIEVERSPKTTVKLSQNEIDRLFGLFPDYTYSNDKHSVLLEDDF
jgi:trehalose-6-phosphate synthase